MAFSVFTATDAAVFSDAGGGTSKKAYDIRGPLEAIMGVGTSRGTLLVISDVVIEDKDIALPVVAVDDKRVLFKFGKDFGALVIDGRLYMGNQVCGDSSSLQKLQDAFEAARLTKADEPSKVSIAWSHAYPVYPVALKFSGTDPKTNSIGFAIQCIIAPVKELK